MKTRRRLAGATTAALLCILALGCSRAPDPQADAADAAAGADRTFIGRQAARAIDKAGEKLRTENIRIGSDSTINVNGHRYGIGRAAKGEPAAELTPDGGLLIAGDEVQVTPEQRALLLGHRRQLEDLALAGMAIGVEGADIAGTALTGIGEALFGGEEGRRAYEARIEAEAKKIELEAMKLCALLPPLYESQQALAASLPAFAPYATMTLDDIDDCGRDADGGTGTDAGDPSDT